MVRLVLPDAGSFVRATSRNSAPRLWCRHELVPAPESTLENCRSMHFQLQTLLFTFRLSRALLAVVWVKASAVHDSVPPSMHAPAVESGRSVLWQRHAARRIAGNHGGIWKMHAIVRQLCRPVSDIPERRLRVLNCLFRSRCSPTRTSLSPILTESARPPDRSPLPFPSHPTARTDRPSFCYGAVWGVLLIHHEGSQ